MSEPTRIEPKIVHGEVRSADLARYPLTTTEDHGIRPHRREQAMSEELRAALDKIEAAARNWHDHAEEARKRGDRSSMCGEEGIPSHVIATARAMSFESAAETLRAALSQPRQDGGLPSVEAFAAAIQSAYDQHDDHRKRHPGHSGACQDDWPSADRLAPLVRARLTAEGSDERR